MNINAIAMMRLSKNMQLCYASFFQDSIIITFIEKSTEKELRKEIKRLIKENKIKLFKRGEFAEKYWEDFTNGFMEKSKEELMAQNSETMALRYSDIETIKVKPYRTHTTKAHETPPIAGQVWFVCCEETYHFNHKYKKEDENLTMLSQVFTHKYVFRER